MEKQTPDAGISETFKRVWLIWQAMLISLLIFGFIAYSVRDEAMEPNMAVLNVLPVIAATMFVMGFYARRFILEGRILPGPRDEQRWLKAHLISYALFESMGIYGVLVIMLGGGTLTMVGFVGSGMLGLLACRPIRARYDAYLNS